MNTLNDEEIALELIKKLPWSLLEIAKPLRTDKLKEEAVKLKPGIISLLNEDERSEKLNLIAVTSKGENIRYLTRNEQTKEIIKAVINSDMNSARYLALDQLDDDVIGPLLSIYSYTKENITPIARRILLLLKIREDTSLRKISSPVNFVKSHIYFTKFSRTIPFIEEIIPYTYSTAEYYTNNADWMRVFYNCSKEYIDKEIYPLIPNPLGWLEEDTDDDILLALVINYTRYGNNFLMTNLFNDYISYLNSLSFDDREEYINDLSNVLENGGIEDEEAMKIVDLFPELKLYMINK